MNLKTYLEFLNDESNVKRKVNVTGAVIIKDNEDESQSVLLIQRDEKDHWPLVWEFPRGKCDKNDSNKLESCLKREVKEETGLKIKIIRYIDKYEYFADEGERLSTQYNYLCKLDPPNQKIKLSFEHQDYKWVSSAGEVELLVPSEMKKTISKVLNQDSKIVSCDYSNKEKIEE